MAHRLLLSSLFALALLGFAPVPAQAQQTLNILCAPVSEWCEAISAAFQRDTGIKVAMARKSSGEILAQLKAEAQNPRTDLWFGGSAETHMVAAEGALLAAYTSANMKDLHPWAIKAHDQAQEHCVGVSSGAIGIIYNKDLAAKKGFKAPKSWADLTDPSYKGEVQMPNPNSSGTAYTIIAGLVQLMGEDQAFAYLRKLHPNMNAYTRSGAAPLRAVSRGETGVAISFNFDVSTDIEAGFPIALEYPSEGTSYEVACMSIIKGTRNEALARKFYDWYLTGPAMDISASVKQWHVPAHKGAKAHPSIPDLSQVKLVDYNFKKFGSAQVRKHILERWEREIGSLPMGQ